MNVERMLRRLERALMEKLDALPASCRDGNLDVDEVKTIIREEFQKFKETL